MHDVTPQILRNPPNTQALCRRSALGINKDDDDKRILFTLGDVRLYRTGPQMLLTASVQNH